MDVNSFVYSAAPSLDGVCGACGVGISPDVAYQKFIVIDLAFRKSSMIRQLGHEESHVTSSGPMTMLVS